MTFSRDEERLIRRLTSAGIPSFEVRRDSNALLLVLRSPCDEIGALTVYIQPTEVMLSCNVTHTHVTNNDSSQAKVAFIDRAADEIIAFVSDRIAVSREYAPNGLVISCGWSPVAAIGHVTPQYKELIEKQYGGPSRRIYWFWSGKSVAL